MSSASVAPLMFGPFRLTVDPARACAYAREIGADEAAVPLAYPAVWLTEPAVYAPVRELCETLDVVPVHESQSFSYSQPLVAGESYSVLVNMRREATPPRLIVDAIVSTLGGDQIATIETMLRLVPRGAFGDAA